MRISRRSRTFGLRRALAGCLVLGVTLIAWSAVSPASAQSGTPRWTMGWDPPAADGTYFDGRSATFSGWFAYDPSGDPGAGSPDGPPKLQIEKIHLVMTRAGSSYPECVPLEMELVVADGGSAAPQQEETTSSTTTPPGAVPFTFAAQPACNGTYQVVAWAEAGDPGEDTEYDTSDQLTLNNQVLSLIPPPVASITATLNGDRTVTVNWTAPADYTIPPDFMGYVIERGSAAAFGAVGAVYPDTFTFTDKSVPPPAGTIVYRVRAVRAGAAGPTAPAYSASAESPTAAVEVGPGTTTTVTHKPSTGSNGTLPNYPRPTSPPTTSVITGDVGPGEESDLEEGEEDPVLPDDEFGAAVEQSFSSEQGGRGVLVPAATFLVLAVWSMHLRYFSKAAARMPLPVVAAPDSTGNDFFA